MIEGVSKIPMLAVQASQTQWTDILAQEVQFYGRSTGALHENLSHSILGACASGALLKS